MAAVFRFGIRVGACSISAYICVDAVVHLFKMNPLNNHIRPLAACLTVCVIVLAFCAQPAFADKAKRAAGARSEVAKAYVSPINGAVSATIRALNTQRGQTGQRQQAKVNVGADSTRRENRFLFARAAQDVFTARIELIEEQSVIDIGIYNMLGKKVMDVYRGYSSRGQHDYTQAVPDLPEGVYICIMQGSDFRKAEKFYFSR